MTLYRAAPADALIAVELDGLSAIYHRASGQTHLLAEPAPQILDMLAGEALSADDLLARMAERYAISDGGREALTVRLAELVATGLVAADHVGMR